MAARSGGGTLLSVPKLKSVAEWSVDNSKQQATLEIRDIE